VEPVQPPRTGDLTALLTAWRRGDQTALERLTPLVYDELRRVARRHIRQERAGQTLQQTALVNEAYIRLVDASGIERQSCARSMMRSKRWLEWILVERT